jgi:hypothetical protein
VHRLMHVLDKTVLTLSAHTEPGHAFLKHIGAVEKNRRTVRSLRSSTGRVYANGRGRQPLVRAV